MRENAYRQRVEGRLKQWGGLWTSAWGGPYSTSGVGDKIGCVDGLYVEIEFKNPSFDDPKKGLTKNQWARMSQVRAHGGIYIVNNDEEELFKQLNEIRQRAQSNR